jgi:hypothetical protein
MSAREQIEAFWKNVNKVSGEYWEWTGTRDVYGLHRFKDECGVWRIILAHRYFWMVILEREAPKGHDLHHNCENKFCVNPEHLELLTKTEHLKRHRTSCKPVSRVLNIATHESNLAEPVLKPRQARLLSFDMLGNRWCCHTKTVRNRVKIFGVPVIEYNGRAHGVRLSDILEAERKAIR